MAQSICEVAIEILRATHDGNDLAPEHLSMIQSAVNGWLTEEGEVEFYRLRESVRQGYKKPWLHGIENLTIDHIGYVYWKSNQVEHYDLSWAYSAEAKTAAEELARRCRVLEDRGIPVNTTNAVWKWET